MSISSSPILFTVTRQEPRLVVPAESPPRELQQLSDIGDQEGLRFQFPLLMFYKRNPFMEGKKDPARVIREALARALVFYYPFAGRITRTSEVTRFSCGPCGGFTFALHMNHTMCDGLGLVQFLSTIAEFAQGKEFYEPSVLPVWQRELLSARKPPRITCLHHEYEQVVDTNDDESNGHMILKSFFFGPKEIRATRNHLPPNSSASTFEVLTACLWRCHTRALALDSNYPVRVSCLYNGRGLHDLHVPNGYYGNVISYPAAVSKAGRVQTFPLEYTVEVVKMAKAQVTAEYFRSVADLMVIKGRPTYTVPGNFFVSDVRHLGLHTVDFGWGKPVYGGAGAFPNISCYMSFKDGIVVPICLSQGVMERFEEELKTMTDEPSGGSVDNRPSKTSSML